MSTAASETYELRPKIPEAAQRLYRRFLEGLHQCRRQDRCQQTLMRSFSQAKELQSLPRGNRLSLQLCFEVFEDLARHGWQFDVKDKSHLTAIPPDVTRGSGQDRQEIKRRLRAMLVEARNEQLREPSVRRFIRKMERPRWHRADR